MSCDNSVKSEVAEWKCFHSAIFTQWPHAFKLLDMEIASSIISVCAKKEITKSKNILANSTIAFHTSLNHILSLFAKSHYFAIFHRIQISCSRLFSHLRGSWICNNKLVEKNTISGWFIWGLIVCTQSYFNWIVK